MSADVHQYPVVANQSWGYRSRHKVRYPQMLSGTVIRSAKPRRDRITSWTVLEYAIRGSRSSHTNTLTFTIESTATLSRPGMPLKPAKVARLVALSSRPDRIGSMARRKCRDVRTVACGARSPSFRRCAVVSEAVPDSRRSRVSPWGQPEVEANPSAGGPIAAGRHLGSTSRNQSFRIG